MPHAADFDPYLNYEAGKPFKFNGEAFSLGDPFRIGDVRRAAQLYGRGMIRVRKGGAPVPVLNSPVPEGRAKAASETLERGNAERAAREAPAYEILEATPGWYDVVDADGRAVNQKRLRRPDAEEMVKELEAHGNDPTA